jgi:hypothetical protein
MCLYHISRESLVPPVWSASCRRMYKGEEVISRIKYMFNMEVWNWWMKVVVIL